jgi:hypothetical protein
MLVIDVVCFKCKKVLHRERGVDRINVLRAMMMEKELRGSGHNEVLCGDCRVIHVGAVEVVGRSE